MRTYWTADHQGWRVFVDQLDASNSKVPDDESRVVALRGVGGFGCPRVECPRASPLLVEPVAVAVVSVGEVMCDHSIQGSDRVVAPIGARRSGRL